MCNVMCNHGGDLFAVCQDECELLSCTRKLRFADVLSGCLRWSVGWRLWEVRWWMRGQTWFVYSVFSVTQEVDDEHFVTTFANVLFRLWTATLFISCKKKLINAPRPRRDSSRLDGWSLCWVFWVRRSVVVIRASHFPNATSANSTTVTTMSREWVAVGGCKVLGGDVSGNSCQLLDGCKPQET